VHTKFTATLASMQRKSSKKDKDYNSECSQRAGGGASQKVGPTLSSLILSFDGGDV